MAGASESATGGDEEASGVREVPKSKAKARAQQALPSNPSDLPLVHAARVCIP